MIAFYLGFALIAGAVVALQTGSNTRLKEALEHAVPAVIGLLGYELHAASVGRLVGCLLLLVGFVLIWKL